MKRVIATAMLSAAMAAPVKTGEGSLSDANEIFQMNSEPMELVVLSSEEMMESEGAFLNFRSTRSFSHTSLFGRKRSCVCQFVRSLEGFDFNRGFSGPRFQNNKLTQFRWWK